MNFISPRGIGEDSLGKMIHKSTERMGNLFTCNNVYISNSCQEISITQAIYDSDILIHKNNVILPVDQLEQIIKKAHNEEPI